MKAGSYWLTGLVCIILFGCTPDKKPLNNPVLVVKKPALTEPFRYYKSIEVSPGQTYDILSWGRGSTAAGSFLILHSDSAGIKYTTTTGDLDGAITEVYNADMDVDGNPEILIQSKGRDTINFTKIYAFEFNNNQANKLNFPKLNNVQKKGYRGEDNFYIRDGKLIREFPVFDGNTKTAKPTRQKRQLEYSLRNNNFTVKQLSKDSVTASNIKPAIDKPIKNTVADKKEHTIKRSVKRKKTETRKKTEKKKRKHRHRK